MRRPRLSSRIAITALIASALAFTGLGATAANAVEADGSITITKTVTDGSSPEGFAFTATSTNCDVAPATATTDADGIAVLAPLPIAQADVTCTYDVTETVREGYELVTDEAALTGLTAGSAVELHSDLARSAVFVSFQDIASSSGPVECLTGVGYFEVRAGGDGAGGCAAQPQYLTFSGPMWAGPDSNLLAPGAFDMGNLTIANMAVVGGFDTATLQLTTIINDYISGDVGQAVTFYTVRLDQAAGTLTLEQAGGQGMDVSNAYIDLDLGIGVRQADGTCLVQGSTVEAPVGQTTVLCATGQYVSHVEVTGTAVAVENAVVPVTTPPASPEPSEPQPTPPTTSEPEPSTAPTTQPDAPAATPSTISTPSSTTGTLPQTGTDGAPAAWIAAIAALLVAVGAGLRARRARA